MSVLSKPYFHDEAAAFRHLESILWPTAPICPHCGSVNAKHYDLGKTRLGLRKCAEKGCRKQFTVKVGTVFEQAHIPLNKCLLALYLMCASKKGISAHQLHRTLEITYKAAWFLCRRIREAMRDDVALSTIMGGPGETIEADETYIGGKAKNRITREPAKKNAVLPLVERNGRRRCAVDELSDSIALVANASRALADYGLDAKRATDGDFRVSVIEGLMRSVGENRLREREPVAGGSGRSYRVGSVILDRTGVRPLAYVEAFATRATVSDRFTEFSIPAKRMARCNSV